MPSADSPPVASTIDWLRLTTTPGVGPVTARRLLEKFGALDSVLGASSAALQTVAGIGPTRSQEVARGLATSMEAAERELTEAERFGARVVGLNDPEYPPLLSSLSDAPPVLYVMGELATSQPWYAAAIVGSRRATAYGIEQAERFATALCGAGLIVTSGGARGVDSAAHRACVRVGGRTIAVLGCGLSHCYPPENAELFRGIVDAGGAVVSELPMRTSPSPENFPARNRIISGMSLGVLVIEAPSASGALITARVAIDEQSREVMALPGRVDSPASSGCLELIKSGSAALVTCPADVLNILEGPARHLHAGTHSAVIDRQPQKEPSARSGGEDEKLAGGILTDRQRVVWNALVEPMSIDELCRATGLDAGALLAETTVLEVRRLVVREGSRLRRSLR